MSHSAKVTPLHPAGAPVRGVRVLHDPEHDPYRMDRKPREPSVCLSCKAVFHAGRWQWLSPPSGAYDELCPACRRIRDHFPAGIVTVEGPFFEAHRDELMSMIQNRAEYAGREHPLERIMDVATIDGGVRINTTDIHIARAIGEALANAYRGKLDFHYEPDQYLLRVHWKR